MMQKTWVGRQVLAVEPERLGFWRGRGAAVTLVELVAVLVIVGILLGILIPAVQQVREQARRTACMSQVRQTALALLNHESQRGALPSGMVLRSEEGFFCRSWMQAILPFVELQSVHDRAVADYARVPYPFVSHAGMQKVVPLWQCPSDPEAGKLHFTHGGKYVASTSYLGVNGTDYLSQDGVFYADSAIRLADVTDGQSNTLMVGERPPSADFWYGWWYAGFGQDGTGSGDNSLGVRELKSEFSPHLEDCPTGPYQFMAGQHGRQCDTLHFWSYHPGGAVFALVDGSVRLIAYDQNPVMPALATRSGGEVVSVPE